MIGIGSAVEQKLGAIGVTERDGVEKGGAAVGVEQIHFGTAERHQRLQTIAVPSAGRAMQSCNAKSTTRHQEKCSINATGYTTIISIERIWPTHPISYY